LLDELNDRPMRSWGMSRRALFEPLDKPALRSLPPLAYEYAAWKRCRVGLDYHVEIAKHSYSVPHQLLRQEVEARITDVRPEHAPPPTGLTLNRARWPSLADEITGRLGRVRVKPR
jgi:hypothetical protein